VHAGAKTAYLTEGFAWCRLCCEQLAAPARQGIVCLVRSHARTLAIRTAPARYLFLIVCLAICALLIFWPNIWSPLPTERGLTTQPIEASAFAAALGVNAHLTWTSTAYGDVTAVEHALDYLGLRNVRDIGGYSFGVYDTLAEAGYRFDFTTIGGSQQQAPSVFSQWLHNFAVAHAGAIASIEGPNEVNIWGINYDGQTGYAGAIAYQTALSQTLSADPVLDPLPVYNLTVASSSASAYNGLGDMSGVADYGALHPYAILGNQPSVQLGAQLSWARAVTPNKPLAITEVGYPTLPTDYWQGVDETTQAKLTLNTVLDATRLGVRATYIYELVDNNVSSGGGAWAHGGLFRSDWSPKPAATALHNLMSVLGSSHGAAPTAAAPHYTVSGLTGYNASLTFHEANGAYDIVVWAEPDIWDATNHAPVAAPAQTATINLAQPVGGYAIYDPLVGVAPVATGGATSHISLTVTDHPLIVELQGAATISRRAAAAGPRSPRRVKP
jgi:hypothetical protein